MITDRVQLRAALKLILGAMGLLPAAQRIRDVLADFTRPRPQLNPEHYERFRRFERRYGNVFRQSLNGSAREQKRVLVFGSGFPEVEAELGLMKALELAGYAPAVVISRKQQLELKYYKLAVRHILFWENFTIPTDTKRAEAIIGRCHSVKDLMKFEYEGVRVGLFAVSTALRVHHVGFLDFSSPRDVRILVGKLSSAMRYASAAQRIVQKVCPSLALFVDGVYSPDGELFDACVRNGVNAISWDVAHKSNALMFKRYNLSNRDQHPWSLSPESWQILREMEWTDAHHERIQQELYGSYASGDWYSTHGTQFNKRILDAASVRNELGLDPRKKTAFVFPHILWDASLNWGKDLFRDYEEWLIETVRVACANDKVNWVIKIHPAHVGKNVVEGYRGDPAEVVVLRKHIGELPPHIIFIPADSSISTFGLFDVMDYCLTVRGTVGIEAARLGIPAVTAGTGRYSNMGFTVDSETREEYLHKVAHIQEVQRLSPEQRELADRFAYGLFVLRPFPLRSFTLEYHDDKNYMSDIQIKIKAQEEWYDAQDLRAFARWADESGESDFLMPLPEAQKLNNDSR